MKKALTASCLWVLWSIAQSASFQSDLDRLINRISPQINLGMLVVDLTSGQTLYRRNPERLYIPASNMKLFSEAAALMILGADYHFKNQLSISGGTIQEGILEGNVYLKLSGDPSFTRDNLRTLLSSLKEWNINSIHGKVFIDSNLASINAYPPGWLTTDLSYSYGAPNAPLMIDANRLTVTVNPGTQVGDPAVIDIDDGSGAITLSNQAVTKASSKGCGLSLKLDESNHLTVRGCIGLGQWAVQERMAIKNPLMYAQGMIKNQLEKAHIEISSPIHLGKTPPGSLLIASEYSKQISELMADTLKPSDNLYAESLYLHAAEKLQGATVNWKRAEPLIKNFLQAQTGINFKNAVFTDGSGLSRYSLVTPEQTVSLLKFLYERFPLSYEYISALPISGRDGTLRKRFRTPNQQGFIRAKTGAMTGINSLSGYLYTANGHTLAFSMFINRLPGKHHYGPGRPVLDALCAYLLQRSPGSSRLARVFSAHQPINFQLNPTEAEKQKNHQTKWRHLESALRTALRGQSVTIAYRDNELIVHDHQADANKVWSALHSLIKKYPFAVLLSSKTLSINLSAKPMLLWVQSADTTPQTQRTWTLRATAA